MKKIRITSGQKTVVRDSEFADILRERWKADACIDVVRQGKLPIKIEWVTVPCVLFLMMFGAWSLAYEEVTTSSGTQLRKAGSVEEITTERRLLGVTIFKKTEVKPSSSPDVRPKFEVEKSRPRKQLNYVEWGNQKGI